MEIRGYRVFYLDPEEDINGLLATLGQNAAKRIALVVHRRSNIFNSRINIQLLVRYLREWPKELVFVSSEERLIRLVLETELKIYPDLGALENDEPITDVAAPIVTSLPTEVLIPEVVEKEPELEDEEIPMYRSNRQQRSWSYRMTIALIAFAILLGVGWFYLSFPIITIEVSPTIQKLERDFQLLGDFAFDQIKLGEAKIPLQNLKYVAKGTASIPTTGRKRIGFTRAEGKIMFVNNQKTAVQLAAGTVVKTATGIKFKTTQVVNVPPLKVNYKGKTPVGTEAGMIEVSIVALESGTQGNVAASQISLFDGRNYGLTAENLNPTTGGTDKEEPIVAQKDLDAAMVSLETELKKQVADELAKKVGTDYILLQETLKFDLNNVEVDHHVDENAAQLTAKGEMVATAYMLMKEDVRLVTRELYMAELPNIYQLYSRDIQLLQITSTPKEDGTVKVNLKASGLVRSYLEPERIARLLKGQSVEYASTLLGKMKEIRYFHINAEGKSRIPKFDFAIRVVIREPEEGEKGSI